MAIDDLQAFAQGIQYGHDRKHGCIFAILDIAYGGNSYLALICNPLLSTT